MSKRSVWRSHAGDEYRAMIYRSVLTEALAAGDWIRFAHRNDTLNPSVDTWARCMGAYAFSGALSVSSVGTGNSAFSSTPSVTTPAGDVVVATVALEGDDDITLDGDWTTMVRGRDDQRCRRAVPARLGGRHLERDHRPDPRMGRDQRRLQQDMRNRPTLAPGGEVRPPTGCSAS